MGNLKTTFLLALMTSLFVFVGRMLGGEQGMIIAFVLAFGMNAVSYWFSDKIVLKLYGAREATRSEAPRLYAVVERLAQRAQIPMPRVYVISTPAPNAFATGRNPEHAAVAATEGILRILNDEELYAVMAHELGHVMHRDTLISTVVATLAGAISMLASMARWAAFFGGGRSSDDDDNGGVLGMLAMAILAPIAAMLIQMAVSRSREFMADEQGAKLSGNPMALASALAKLERGVEAYPMAATPGTMTTAHLFIVNPLSARGLANLFSTHPPVEERIARLQQMAAGVRGR